MKFLTRYYLSLLLLLWGHTGLAQTSADLVLRRNMQTQQAEVYLRANTLVSGVLTNLQFTLEGEFISPASGSWQQAPGTAAWMPLQESGPVFSASGTWRQIFAGFGLVPLPSPWQPGTEILLLTVPVGGQALPSVRIATGAWAQDNNGTFYLEADGKPITGGVESPLDLEPDMAPPELLVYPNPADHTLMITLPIAAGRTTVGVYDSLGRLLETQAGDTGTTVTLDIRTWPAGHYWVRAAGHAVLFEVY
ncbi:MAG: T9SS type A sorting domain-containing protein [Bacteroidia bacterium]|nr:T9SS type A sorting domain-containing protein [Bacteroidia bacterium]